MRELVLWGETGESERERKREKEREREYVTALKLPTPLVVQRYVTIPDYIFNTLGVIER